MDRGVINLGVKPEKNVEDKISSTLPIEDKIKFGYPLSKADILSPEGLLVVECLAREGCTLQQIAEKLGISMVTFWGWRKNNDKLDDACRRGKELVNYEVESALLKAALGYKQVTVKTYINFTGTAESGAISKIEKTETDVAPSVTACLAWLNNRASNRWHRTNSNEITVDDEDNNITINIIKGGEEKQ